MFKKGHTLWKKNKKQKVVLPPEEKEVKPKKRAGRPPAHEGRNCTMYVRVRPEVQHWYEEQAKVHKTSQARLADAMLNRGMEFTYFDLEKILEKRFKRNVSRPVQPE